MHGYHEHTFSEFQRTEYENLAQAHFNMVQTISTFFRHYVLILSIVIAAGGAILNNISKQQTNENIPILLNFSFVTWVISIAGIFLLWYILSIRFDAILYARAVNGIRKYFYDRRGFSPAVETHIRVLPKTITFPAFFEISYFLPVVLTFGLFDSALIFAGGYISNLASLNSLSSVQWGLLSIGFFLSHILIYLLLSDYRENEYIRSKWIGVDIDGVLNDHKEQFCRFAKMQGKIVHPMKITKIPVHECSDLSIKIEDEYAIFNNPEYWESMQPTLDCVNILRKLRNDFGYKVHLFTYRPWPKYNESDKPSVKQSWRWKSIKRITRKWLKSNNLYHNKLTIERGNVHLIDTNFHYKNRFRIAAQKHFRLFVEDDLQKAIKLAGIVDIVFLLDQPYNKCEAIPSNVIRVNGWIEMFHYIRDSL